MIKLTVDLAKDNKYENVIEGITDKKNIDIENIHNIRGEFCGYVLDGHKLTIVRDRLGAKSIYYARDNDTVWVSTEIKWIFDQLPIKSFCHDYILGDYLQFQIPFSGATFYNGINRVMPGEYIEFGQKQYMNRVKYWEPKFGDASFNANHLKELIINSIEYRKKIIGNDRFTAYVSGGVDSSSIALIAKPDSVFSGTYDEEEYSEMDYIRKVAELMKKTRFNYVKINEYDFHKELENLKYISPDPMCGLGIIPQVLVARQAKRMGFNWAFTGEGGDEIFTGYNWNTIIFTLNKALDGLLRDRYMVRYEKMVEGARRRGLIPLTGGLLGRGDNSEYAVNKIMGIWDKDQPVENNILKINLTVGLPAILYVDETVGKFSGVMPISPLVDHNIVEYICSIRGEERNNIPKYFFREAMKGILPEKIRTRYEKMGFPVPADRWGWPMLKDIKIDFLDVPELKTMDRNAWAYYNIHSIINGGNK